MKVDRILSKYEYDVKYGKKYYKDNKMIEFWYFADRASQYIYRNINQPDVLNFIISLFHASTCFEHIKLVLR
jgi:hypothetical protein